VGGVTRLRSHQTRASERYDLEQENLATDQEVETRVRKHSSLFHHNRNDNTELEFDAQGNLSEINVYSEDGLILLARSTFSFDAGGNLNSINKKVYEMDGSEIYMELQKDFVFDTNGNLSDIQNTKIT